MILRIAIGDVSRARFWKRVSKDGPGGCWLWTGALNSAYGQLRDENNARVGAHRFSWAVHFGDAPDGLGVLHRCDNPPCVNPDHLFLGTNKDNVDDKTAKARHPTGANGWKTRLRREIGVGK